MLFNRQTKTLTSDLLSIFYCLLFLGSRGERVAEPMPASLGEGGGHPRQVLNSFQAHIYREKKHPHSQSQFRERKYCILEKPINPNPCFVCFWAVKGSWRAQSTWQELMQTQGKHANLAQTARPQLKQGNNFAKSAMQ